MALMRRSRTPTTTIRPAPTGCSPAIKHRVSAENFGAVGNDFPHIGSVISKLWPGDATLPTFVALPEKISTTVGAVVPGQTGGMLGQQVRPVHHRPPSGQARISSRQLVSARRHAARAHRSAGRACSDTFERRSRSDWQQAAQCQRDADVLPAGHRPDHSPRATQGVRPGGRKRGRRATATAAAHSGRACCCAASCWKRACGWSPSIGIATSRASIRPGIRTAKLQAAERTADPASRPADRHAAGRSCRSRHARRYSRGLEQRIRPHAEGERQRRARSLGAVQQRLAGRRRRSRRAGLWLVRQNRRLSQRQSRQPRRRYRHDLPPPRHRPPHQHPRPRKPAAYSFTGSRAIEAVVAG